MNEHYVNPFGWNGYEEDATYHEQILPMYQGNPLIEALPTIQPHQEALRALTLLPSMKGEYRTLSSEFRMHMIRDIDGFFQPLPKHGRLYDDVSGMIYKGYIGRNPIPPGFWKMLDDDIERLTGNMQNKGRPAYRKNATAMSLIGISGIGKTRSLAEILALLPQIINHSVYQGVTFPWKQLVWLKLECPHNGSTRSLGIAFFEQIDWILGTNYTRAYTRNGRASEMELLQKMARVGAMHSLGVLVIDEIQALSKAKSGGAEHMLNFFVELVNTLGLPIILVGTYKAQELFSQAFRQARRASSHGGERWDRMQKDQDWALVSETLWQFQYTKNHVELTPELSDVLYDLSQGITDIAIKVFMLGQILAIRTGEERLTPDILKRASEKGLALVQPFLKALRMNDTKALLRMEDIQPIDIDKAIKVVMGTDPEQVASATNNINPSSQGENSLGVELVKGSLPDHGYEQLRQQSHISDVASELNLSSSDVESEPEE